MSASIMLVVLVCVVAVQHFIRRCSPNLLDFLLLERESLPAWNVQQFLRTTNTDTLVQRKKIEALSHVTHFDYARLSAYCARMVR